MTKEPEIRAVRRSDHSVEIDLHIPETLALFADHFPRMGLLPGVVQIDWAARWGVEHFALPGTFRGLRNVKFVKPILPGADVTLTLTRRGPGRAEAAIEFEYRGARRTFSSGRILFDGAANG
jgi:3-hydroxymyristoyl/3-hydroxydecanoyl-(acyl carrier protein) dehydratase